MELRCLHGNFEGCASVFLRFILVDLIMGIIDVWARGLGDKP